MKSLAICSLLVLVAGGCARNANLCSPGGEACNADSDCCSELFCNEGVCRLNYCGDGVCGPGENGNNCCRDCPCGPGSTCDDGVQCQPVNTDGPCPFGELTCKDGDAGCCQGCICPTGSACAGIQGCRPSATMSWSIIDQCASGSLTIEFNFFDQSGPLFVQNESITLGNTSTSTVSCFTGDTICIGAADAGSPDLYWGVGIEGTKSLSGPSFCFTCEVGLEPSTPLWCKSS
jgi:hypothetical protein